MTGTYWSLYEARWVPCAAEPRTAAQPASDAADDGGAVPDQRTGDPAGAEASAGAGTRPAAAAS